MGWMVVLYLPQVRIKILFYNIYTMKDLEKKEQPKKIKSSKWKNIFTVLIAGVLSFAAPSCKRATPESVSKTKTEVVVTKNKLHYLNQKRKDLVVKHNDLLSKAWTPWYTGPDFDNSKAQIDKALLKVEKDLRTLIKQKAKKEQTLTKQDLKLLEQTPDLNGPLDENAFDFVDAL